jgi:hypothetical protein
MKRPILLVFASALALTAGTTACKKAGESTQAEAVRGTELGINKASMDTSVKPGDDFYAYANGAWMKSAEIPADRSSIGSHLIADQQTEKNLNELISGLQNSTPDANSDAGRVKNFYNSFLDTATIDKLGMSPIQGDLQAIAEIKDKTELARAIGGTVRADVDPLNATDMSTENLFGVFVSQALAQREVVPYIMQGGLGMPEREYYLSGDADMRQHQAAYRKYIADLLTAAGIPDAAAKAQRIWDLELKIANAQATREERDDWSKATQIWSQDDFAKKAPGLDWKTFFQAAQLGNQQKFEAFDAGAIPKLAALVASEPLDSWKDWLTFHQINQNTSVLPSKLDQLSFAFNGKEIFGTEQQRPRDKRAIGAVNARQALHRQIFPRLGQGRDPGDGEEHQGGVRPADRYAQLDGALHQGGSQEEGRVDDRRRRLSGQVDGLFVAQGRSRHSLREQASGREAALHAAAGEDRQAARHRRMVDERPVGERREPAGAERPQFPGSDLAAALL